jgi:branched-chain amino acid transport system permease protein
VTELAQALVGGILIGGLYVAISIGFSLSFGVLDVVDLAVGMWVVLGAFAAVVASEKLKVDAFLLLPAVFVAFGVVGWLIAPLIYRVRTSKYALPALMGLAFTFGLATLIRGGLLTLFGYTPRTVHTAFFSGNVELLGITAPAIRVAGFAFAVVATGLFLAFLFYTRTGLAIRATAQSKENAGLMGVDVKRISSLVYAIYTGLTAMAGALLGRRLVPRRATVVGHDVCGCGLHADGGLRGAVRGAAVVPARHLAPGPGMSRPASGGNPYLNLGVLAAVVAAMCLLPMMTSPYYIRVATGVAMWAGIALSWNVICGYAGYISFGHVAFFGIGAYTTAILMQPDVDWNFWATLPVAAVIAGAVAALVGWPALRLKGAYFAIATWALAEAVREFATVVDFTGGSGGLKTPIRLDDNFFFYMMLGAAAIAYALCYFLLERSRFGFRVKAVRDNEAAARAQGINTTLVKIEAFMLSAMIPAVLGGINAYWITFINPDSVLNTIITDQLVVMVLVGGLGHAWGPALGAAAMFLMQEQLRVSYGETTAYIIIVGALVMAVVLFLPDGLVSLGQRARRMRLVRQLLGRARDDVAPPRTDHETEQARP